MKVCGSWSYEQSSRADELVGRIRRTGVKILFAHQNLGAFGGAEANILLTASVLKGRGHQVALLYQTNTGKNEQAWRETFSFVFRCAAPENIPAVLREVEPDVIYLHTISDLQVLQELVGTGIPTVRMVHDHEMYCLRGYKYNYFTRKPCQRAVSFRCVFPCLASVARNRTGGFPLKWASYRAKRAEIEINQVCDHFVVYSEYSKAELIRNGFDPSRIEIVVPIQCWGNDGPRSTFSDRNLLLYVGQIIRGKGVDLLLRALAKLEAPFECLIIGDGGHRKACERLSHSLGLSDRVRFTGFLPSEQIKAHYLEATALAVSSVWPEPFGMVGPEAMRYGLPVVAFDAGGISEWLTEGENGFLVAWGDVDGYARCLGRLLRDKALAKQLGRQGLERVNRDYEAGRQIDRIEAVLGSVANRATQPCPASIEEPDSALATQSI